MHKDAYIDINRGRKREVMLRPVGCALRVRPAGRIASQKIMGNYGNCSSGLGR